MRTWNTIFTVRRSPAALTRYLCTGSSSRALDAANGAGRWAAGPWVDGRRHIDVCMPGAAPTELLATRVTQSFRDGHVSFAATLAGVHVESLYRAWAAAGGGGETLVEASVTVDAALPWPVRDAVEGWVLRRSEASVRAVMADAAFDD